MLVRSWLNGEKLFGGNPRLQVAPRAIIEEVVLGVPLEEDDADGKD